MIPAETADGRVGFAIEYTLAGDGRTDVRFMGLHSALREVLQPNADAVVLDVVKDAFAE